MKKSFPRFYKRKKANNTTAKLDKLWLEILKKERGERDEIDGRPANGLGVFHILCKGNHPRLRYARENCLLVNWLPHHHNWHHYTHNDHQYEVVENAIKKLRGDNYKERLLVLEMSMPRLTPKHKQDLLLVFSVILKELKSPAVPGRPQPSPGLNGLPSASRRNDKGEEE